MPTKKKRFSVSLDPEDYRRLKRLAAEHRPKLTLQYYVELAVKRLLEATDDRDALEPLPSGGKRHSDRS
ncbi:MAG: hypothetical protein ACREON_11665 [Gemmatimonadaceae bacterium]